MNIWDVPAAKRRGGKRVWKTRDDDPAVLISNR
jgi:hypothetical protein